MIRTFTTLRVASRSRRSFATVTRQFSNDYVYNGMLAGSAGLLVSGIPTAVQAVWMRHESLREYLMESLTASGNLVLSTEHSRQMLLTTGALTDVAVSVGAGVLIAYLTRPNTIAEPVDTSNMVMKCAGIALALHSVNLFVLPSVLNSPLMDNFIRQVGWGTELLDFAAYGAGVGATLAYIQNRGIPMMTDNMAWSGTGPSGGTMATKTTTTSTTTTPPPSSGSSSASPSSTASGNK